MNPINTGLLVTNERNWRAQHGQGKSKQAKYLGSTPNAPVERNVGTHPSRVVSSSSSTSKQQQTSTTSNKTSNAPVERNGAVSHQTRQTTSSSTSKQQTSTSSNNTSNINIDKTRSPTKGPANTVNNTGIEKKKNVKCRIM